MGTFRPKSLFFPRENTKVYPVVDFSERLVSSIKYFCGSAKVQLDGLVVRRCVYALGKYGFDLGNNNVQTRYHIDNYDEIRGADWSSGGSYVYTSNSRFQSIPTLYLFRSVASWVVEKDYREYLPI